MPFIFDYNNWIVDNVFIVLLADRASLVSAGRHACLRSSRARLTSAINYALGGLNVWGYHLANLAVHLLAAWTLFRHHPPTPPRRSFANDSPLAATPLALVAATLWVIHPLQTEAVTYIVQRTESLAGLLYLLTLYCVIRGATSFKATPWYIAAVGSLPAGHGHQGNTGHRAGDRCCSTIAHFWPARFNRHAPTSSAVFGLAATWVVVAALSISTRFYGGTTGFAVQKFTWWSYLLTQSGVIVRYLQLAFWPAGLCLDYNWPPAHPSARSSFPGSSWWAWWH